MPRLAESERAVEARLAVARAAYVRGELSPERLEQTVAHVLRGGYIGTNLELRSRLMDRVRGARRCRELGHDWIDVTLIGHSELLLCGRCGRTTT